MTARWLPVIAALLAVMALAVALLRPAVPPAVDSSDITSLQQEVNLAKAATEALSERVAALEHDAAASPATDVEGELSVVRGQVADLAAGLETACSALDDLSNRIDDLSTTVDGSITPPSFGGSC